MTETFVLHLHSRPLSCGDVRGLVEVVATGERIPVRTLEELHRLLVRSAPRTPPGTDQQPPP